MNNLDYKRKKKITIIAITTIIVVLSILLAIVLATNSENEEPTRAEEENNLTHQTEVPEGYTAIYNATELANISSNLSGNYILMADINLSGVDFKPIGQSSSSSFNGTLDGNNYAIKNMTINSGNQYVGLFGYAKGGTIKNLVLEDATVISTYTSNNSSYAATIGGLAGSVHKGRIENVTITGTSNVSTTEIPEGTAANNKVHIGGVVGSLTNTNIINSSTNANVTANTASGEIRAGGLVGYAVNSYGTCKLEYVYASGSVNTCTKGTQYVGGLLGDTFRTYEDHYANGVAYSRTNYTVNIKNACATGKVEVKVNTEETITGTVYAGGLVGHNNGYLTNCYELGDVKVDTVNTVYAGGLIGNNGLGNITNTYAVGNVSIDMAKTKNIGRLIGGGANAKILNSYWAPETTGQYDDIYSSARPKQLQSMFRQTTYTGWDFDTIWAIDEGECLPYLRGLNKPEELNDDIYIHKIYDDGKGTLGNPYIITNEEQLQAMRNEPDAHYKMANDIILENNFEPIVQSSTYPFSGTLDGAGYKITGLNIESNNQYVGMFGYVNGGTIKNVILEDINITSKNAGYLGGIAGYTTGTNTKSTTIENVSIIGTSKVSTASNSVYMGGIVGYTSTYTNIASTSSNADLTTNSISGTIYVGGLVGYNSGTISTSYATGEVTATSTSGIVYAGGLIGYRNSGTITNTYAVGKVEGSTTGSNTAQLGGLIGGGTTATTTNTLSSYWAPETTGVLTSNGGTPKQLQSMFRQNTYTDWDFDTIWAIDEGEMSLPYLKNLGRPDELNEYTNQIYNDGEGILGNPYIITNEEQLQAMRNEPDAHYKIGNDITLSSGSNFEPIGLTTTYPFTGSLDGNNKKIVGLNIESNNKYVGMFGYVKGATIKNLTLESATVKTTYTYNNSSSSYAGYVGIVAGAITGTNTSNVATIENVSIIGESTVSTAEPVTGTNTVYIGGLAGYAYSNTNITNTNSSANITANATSGPINAGGIVGYNSGAISLSYTTGPITTNATTGTLYVGGLVGDNRATLNTSYSTGNVKATNTTTGTICAGGLIGYNNSNKVSDTYSTSKLFVNSTSGAIYVGGLVGSGNGTIKNSYAVGKIEEANSTGSRGVGGFIGSGSASVTNSYWSPEATGQYVSATKGEEDKLLHAMLYKYTFTDWDFDNVWGIVEGETLPYLKNLKLPEDVNKYKYSYTEYREGKGTLEDPYIIRTEAQLQGMKNALEEHYKLGNDIILENNFEPIGQNATYPFTGSLDGDGFKITNLNINSANQYVGMFGYAKDATIKNLAIENATVTSTYTYNNSSSSYAGCIGTVAGAITTNVTIENVSIIGESSVSTAEISEGATVSNTVYIGGIVGYANNSSIHITNTNTNANIKANTTSGPINAGGLVGYNISLINTSNATGSITTNTASGQICAGGLVGYNSFTINTSYATGSIISTSTTGAIYAGGLVGNNKSSINKSYATSSITATSTSGTIYEGGLSGYSNGTLSDTYSTSKLFVNSTSRPTYVGGLVGQGYGTIKNSYAVGKIEEADLTGSKSLGGLIGSGSASVTNSYWSPKATGQETSAGGTVQETDALLYRTGYADTWNFEGENPVWTIEEGETLAYLKDLEKPDNISKNDFEYESRIEVYVKDSKGNPLKDGKYEIKDSTGTKVAEGVSNSKGIVYIYNLPEKNAIYTIEEIEAPAGYKKITGTKEFKFTEATLVVDPTTEEEIKLEYIHDLIELSLRNEDTEGNGIKGAVIGLFDADGNIVKGTDGREVKGSTDNNGNVKFTKLNPGTYKYKQISSKIGYRMDETEYTVTIADDGAITWGEANNGVIVNEKILKDITITKTGEIKNSEEIVYLEGIEIALYNSNGVEVATKTTNKEGQVTFENLGVGTYNYIEKTTLDGYEMNTTRYYVRINQDETIEYLNSNGKDATIHNYLTKGTIIIRKYSNYGYSLSGAVIGLYDGEGNPVLGEDGKQIRKTTNYQGIARFARLEPGVYKFREISAPSGYYLNSRMYTVTINDDEEYSLTYAEGDSGVIYNTRRTYNTTWSWGGSSGGSSGWHGPITIDIVWNHGGGSGGSGGSGSSGGGSYRPGGSSGSGGSGSSSGHKTGTIGSSGGSTSISGLGPGEYEYTITDGGSGGPSETGKFTIGDDGSISFQGEPPSGITTDTGSITTDVTVSGGSGNTGDKIHLHDGDGNPLYNEDGRPTTGTIDENGNVTFTGLGPGDYSYPKDGDKPGNHKFTVGNDGKVTVGNDDDLPNKNLVKYKVIHYKQNDTLDGYDEFETEELSAREEMRVTATAKDYEGYYLNKAKSKETGIVQADGSLVLKMYYDKEVSTVFAVNITNIVAEDGTPIVNSKFDVTIKYSNGTEEVYADKITDENGNILLNLIPTRTNIMKVILKQKEVPDGIEIDSDEKYVQIKTNAETKEIELTGSQSSDIFAKTEEGENTVYIVVENNKKPENYSDYTLKIIETDKENSAPVAGVRNKVKQTGITDGYMQKTKDEKVTNASGEAIYEVLDKDEITFTIERLEVPEGYKLIRGRKEVKVRKNDAGDYELVNEVDGVTIDTANKQIIVNRQVYKIGSEFDKPKAQINNTLFITKVDEELRPLQGVTMELRASYEGTLINTWELTTDDEGMAKLTNEEIIASLGSEYPQLLTDKKGRITFMITEKSVPIGYELLEGIGFEAYYEFDPNGQLKIMYMNVLDGASYTRIVDQEYDQYEEEEYMQIDMKLKVINPYGSGIDLKTLKIEKVDGLDNNIKLPNTAFKVTLKYPEGGKLRINGITNINGVLSIPKSYFPEGGTTTVEIEEKIAPKGYTIDTAKTVIEVTNTAGVLTIDGETVGEDGTVLVRVENNKNGGFIEYKPEDEVPSINSYAIRIDKVSSTSDKLKLNGAEFRININQENGYNYVATRKTRNRMGTGVSGLTGTGKIKVRVKEIVAPDGYILNGITRELVFTRDAVTKQLSLDISQLRNIDARDIIVNNTNHTITIKVRNTPRNYIGIIGEGDDPRNPTPDPNIPDISLDPEFNPGIDPSGRYNAVIIENEDIDVNSIKIEGTTFEVRKLSSYLSKGITNENGLTAENIGTSGVNTVVQYTIINKEMEQKGYIKNPDVILQVTYNEEGKMQSAEFISEGMYASSRLTSNGKIVDAKGRIVAEVDESVNYVGKNVVKVNIRCAKAKYISVTGGGGGGLVDPTSPDIPTTPDKPTTPSDLPNPTNPTAPSPDQGGTDPDNPDNPNPDPDNPEVLLHPDFGVLLEKVNIHNDKIKVEGAKYRINVLNEETGESITKIDSTNSQGQISFTGLLGYGNFTITISEIDSPEEYALDTNKHILRVNRDSVSQMITILEEGTVLGDNETARVDNINKVIKTTIKESTSSIGLGILKLDSLDEKTALKNAEFEIIDNETTYILKTGEEGMGYISLPIKSEGVHTFTIREKTAPVGYKDLVGTFGNKQFTLNVEYDSEGLIKYATLSGISSDIADIDKLTTDYIEMSILDEKQDDPDTYDIELIKGDAYYPSVTFANAKIKIDVDHDVGIQGLTKTELTDANGKIYLNDMYGTGKVVIKITELEPPPGRRFDTKTKQVILNINEENKWIELDKHTSNVDTFIDNDNRKVTIRIRNYPENTFIVGANKVDAEDNDLILTGAEYKLQLVKESGELDTREIMSKETVNGLLTFGEIPMPSPLTSKQTYTYLITETKAPEDYLVNPTPVVLKVEVSKVNGINTITNAYIEKTEEDDSITQIPAIKIGDEYVHIKLEDIVDPATRTKITVHKEWVDTEAQKAKRPASIVIQAKNGETVVAQKEIVDTSVNTDVIFDLPRYDADKNEIAYTIEEVEKNVGDLEYYVSTSKINADGTITITNKFTVPESKLQVSIKKVVKGTEIGLSGAVIELYEKEGDIEKNKVESTTDVDGYAKFEGLKPNTTYYYKEKEAPTGYSQNETVYSFNVNELGEIEYATGSNGIIENERVKGSVSIRKLVTGTTTPVKGAVIGLYNEDETPITDAEGKPLQGTTGDTGEVIFSGLTPGNYKYKEENAPIQYQQDNTMYEFTVNNDGTITFKNDSKGIIYNSIKTVGVTVHKVWIDTDIQRAKRPANIVIRVKNGDEVVSTQTISSADTEKEIDFTGLPEYDAEGNKITYTIEEVAENEGDLKFYVSEVETNADGTITITNRFTVPEDKVSVGVHKVWVDTDGQRVKRPANIVIRVKNGDEVVSTQTISSADTEKDIDFTDLPKYDADGNEIEYTVEEVAENEGDLEYYVSTIEGNTITNRFTVPASKLQVSIRKIDKDTKVGLPGARIELYDAEGNSGEDTTDENGYVTFGGLNINTTYYYKEKTPPTGYTLNDTVYSFRVNELGEIEDIKVVRAENGDLVIENDKDLSIIKTGITVHKVWVDTDGQRIKRPANIVIQVKNGDEVVSTQTISSADTEKDIDFTGLPKYDAEGNEIEYTVEEVAQKEGDLEYYVPTIVKNADGTYTITNTFTVPASMLQVSIRKIDKDTKIGLPGAVIELYDAEGNSGEDTTDENGYVTFGGLKLNTTYYYKEKKAPTGYTLNDTVYSFKVNELGEIEDVKVVRAENGDLVIENDKDLSIIKTGITVHKVWVDTDGQRIKRPANIVIQVKNGDIVVATKTVTNVTEKIDFTDLPKYDAEGNEITYTIEEVAEREGDLKFYVPTIVKNADGTYTITNTFTVPASMLQVSIRKIDKETKIGLPGARIELYEKEGDTEKNKVEDTTNADGYVTFGGLNINTTYYYKEKTPPTGYSLNDTVYSFRVNELGEIEDIKVVRAENGDLVIENDKELGIVIRGKATIVKYITGTEIPLEGAVIGLYDEENNLVVDEEGNPIQLTTTSEGKVVFENLIPGKTYKYKEITAPTGYKLNETTYSFTVAEDGTIIFAEEPGGILYNEPIRIDVPIYKIDIVTKEVIKGATIKLYNADGTEIEAKETGEDGYVTFNGVIVGKTYKYQEIAAPAGYKLNNTMYEFTINADGTIVYNNYIEIDGVKYLCVYDTPEKDDVVIIKKDIITGAVLSGAKIGVYDEEGNLLEDAITDVDGKVVFSGFTRGKTYLYREITAPVGYELNETTYSFTVAEDGTIIYAEEPGGIIYNEPIRIDVPIYKVDIITKEVLKGATIKLYDADGIEIEAKETGEDGYVTFYGVIVGRTYKYKEIIAPNGYKLDETMYEFTVNADGTINYNNYIEIDGIKYLCIYNEPLRVDVPIYKIDILTNEVIKGATIKLYNADGTEVETKETGEGGYATFSGLIVGKTYKYQETVAPLGYKINNAMYEFTVNADGTIIYNNYIEIDGVKYLCIYDEPLRIDVPIYKMDLITKQLLKGAKIELYDKDGNIIEAKETGEDGIVVFNNLIVGRTYKYKEIVAPDGYKLDDTMYEFTINRDGTITYGNYIEIDGKKYAVIYDTPIKDYVIIVKKDIITGKLLRGAVIGVYDDKGNMVQGTTDADGKVIFSGFTRGVKYRYKEITAPVGYKLNKTVYSFIINDDGTISYDGETDGIIYNEPIRLTITKKDIATGKLLPGAVIGLYDENGNMVQGTTNEDGTIIFGGLLAGKTYRYKEIKAPVGYVLNETMYTVRISDEGEISYEGETGGIIYNERMKIDVPVYKMEKGTRKLLSGAVIGLYDKDGKPILRNGEHLRVTTNIEGEAIFTGLEVGEIYQYKEEVAPSGYNLNENVATFRITAEGKVIYDTNGGIIYDEKILVQSPDPSGEKLPQTGINTIVLGVLMSLAGASTMATIYYKKKISK